QRLSGEIACSAMNAGAKSGRFPSAEPLPYQRGNNASEAVACAAGGHARIAGGVYRIAPSVANDRLMPLEDHRHARGRVALAELCHRGGALSDGAAGRLAGQARKLARMRGENSGRRWI